jgi:hypothetical protein
MSQDRTSPPPPLLTGAMASSGVMQALLLAFMALGLGGWALPTLQLNTTKLEATGGWVRVSWESLSPDIEDSSLRVAFFSPAIEAGAELSDGAVPVKFQFTSASTSSNYLDFRLLNLRDEEGYSVIMLRGSLFKPEIVARAESAIVFKDPLREVQHLHLSLTGAEDEMRVSWVTGSMEGGHQKVEWWPLSSPEAKHLSSSHNVDTITYSEEELCTVTAFHDPGLQHSFVMSELQAGEEYGFSVNGQRGGTFVMPPLGSTTPVRLAIFGDMGTAELDGSLNPGSSEPASIQTVGLLKKFLEQGRLGAALHIGDISYARGYDTQWDQFMELIEPVSSRVPYMLAGGNHEWDSTAPRASRPTYFKNTDSGGECGVPYSRRFRMPGTDPWYSFDFGPIHFTVISTEHDFHRSSEQFKFIAQDFASARANVNNTPWLVLAGHRPMYVDSMGPGTGPCDPPGQYPCANDQPVATELRDALENLMLRHQVDLAVFGHHHSYQRTCPVAFGHCIEGGSNEYSAPVHTIVGMAGMGLTTNIETVRPAIFEYVNDWSHGLSIVEANATTLHMTFYLDDDEGTVGDDFWLFKDYATPFRSSVRWPSAIAAAARRFA